MTIIASHINTNDDNNKHEINSNFSRIVNEILKEQSPLFVVMKPHSVVINYSDRGTKTKTQLLFFSIDLYIQG